MHIFLPSDIQDRSSTADWLITITPVNTNTSRRQREQTRTHNALFCLYVLAGNYPLISIDLVSVSCGFCITFLHVHTRCSVFTMCA
ncbi:hypothetical protein L208DRAFT_940622 [Tricholoma matsutake]|nr:hypothetical protein L208DRAFT_940622 [Tricholoma matsutake 945]